MNPQANKDQRFIIKTVARSDTRLVCGPRKKSEAGFVPEESAFIREARKVRERRRELLDSLAKK